MINEITRVEINMIFVQKKLKVLLKGFAELVCSHTDRTHLHFTLLLFVFYTLFDNRYDILIFTFNK